MDIQKVIAVAESAMEGTDMFVVDCTITPSNDITLVVDAMSSVSIDRCAEISRTIDSAFDRDKEDYSLTVCSAGIGEPLKNIRQYKKLVGSTVEVLLADGTKCIATLDEIDDNGIAISYDEKVAVEGCKRKQLQHTTRRVSYSEIKWTKEYLDYK